MHNFKELKVWEEAQISVKAFYGLTVQLPNKDTFVLTSQNRRSAVSIPSNRAEGFVRGTQKGCNRFLNIA